MKPVVGVDFDNTLVDYSRVINETAAAMGLIAGTGGQTKCQIRNLVRQLPDGELKWQNLQAEVYGSEIRRAVPGRGSWAFLETCKQLDVEVYIVSHKTRFAAQDIGGVDLREAAVGWLDENGFLGGSRAGIDLDRVYFEETQHDKVQRIGALGCTHFIDDLMETFLDPSFPSGVTKILYSPHPGHQPASDIIVAVGWDSAARLVFDGLPAN